MADSDFDLTESATPFKLEEARQKGSVAKSIDFTTMVVLAAMAATLYANGAVEFKKSVYLMLQGFSKAGRVDWSVEGFSAFVAPLLLGILQVLAPLFLAVVVAAVAANLFQTGPVFSLEPVSPDFDRINPARGFKRVFSLRTVYETFKNAIKLFGLGLVLYHAIFGMIPGLMALTTHDPKSYPQVLLGLAGSLVVKMVMVLLVLALLDLAYTRWEFAKRMRMSRRDVKDEVKQREGDPRIRARIRDLRKEMLKRSKAMRKLPSADVLITNPTHIAVALVYKRETAAAPQLVAKGAGDLARRMREAARKHSIPVVQNRALARDLYEEVDFEGFVPERLYPQLAKIMVWVHTLRKMRNRTMGGA